MALSFQYPVAGRHGEIKFEQTNVNCYTLHALLLYMLHYINAGVIDV